MGPQQRKDRIAFITGKPEFSKTIYRGQDLAFIGQTCSGGRLFKDPSLHGTTEYRVLRKAVRKVISEILTKQKKSRDAYLNSRDWKIKIETVIRRVI